MSNALVQLRAILPKTRATQRVSRVRLLQLSLAGGAKDRYLFCQSISQEVLLLL